MAELTDDQWVDELIAVIRGLIDGSLTSAAADARLTLATKNWPTRTLSNADLVIRISRFFAQLDGFLAMAGPPDPEIGKPGAYYMNTDTGDFYGPKKATGWGGTTFSLVGPAGQSAKQIVIAAGLLPAGATDAQFATWLANSQKAAVQPLLDDAKTARDQAVAAKADVEADAQAAAANALATNEDRAATAADAQATGADRLAIAAAAQAATEAAQSTAADRQATGADAQATDADRQAAQSAAASADADAQATAADRAATAADAQATAEDRQSATAAAQSAEADAQATAADRQATGEDHTAVQALRAEALGFRNEAEQFRNEAGEIAGGDFLTEATADGRYRKLADLLAIADVNGLGAALAGKVTTQQLSDAVQAIVGMAPADLDTLKEIADRLVDAEGDYAALVGVIAGKASQASVDALTGRVTALEGRPQPVVKINGQSPDAAGAITLEVSASFDPAAALAAFDAA
ncbi:hypothetical protein [uncultured Brevundimonas sp.]|uniref:hypothetical protein n=1 Tax=uncultured Brevundimonas sp. TaxID=213418 RepID=UPI0025EE449A|nr:hypothetical protein [uncultured Brevundimonas sp.]